MKYSLSDRILSEGAAIGRSIYLNMIDGNRTDAREQFRNVSDPDRLACAMAEFFRMAQFAGETSAALQFLASFAVA